MATRSADHPDAYALAFDEQVHLFLDEHRRALIACLDGLSEEQAMGLVVNGFIEPITKTLPMEYAVEWSRLIELQMEGSVG